MEPFGIHHEPWIKLQVEQNFQYGVLGVLQGQVQSRIQYRRPDPNDQEREKKPEPPLSPGHPPVRQKKTASNSLPFPAIARDMAGTPRQMLRGPAFMAV
jgi:hypothetical protein